MARNQGRHASGDLQTPMTRRIFRLIFLQLCLVSSVVAHTPASVAAQSGTGLVAAYGFEDGSGTTLNDLSGNQNNGTLQNGPVWVTTGKYGKALRFDGNDDLVTVSDSNSLDLTTSMTLEAWVYPTTALASWDTILLKEQTNGLVYSLYANGDVNNPFTYIFSGGTEYGTGGGTSLPVNTWTHVAATFDGNVIRLFINGTQVGSALRTGSILTSNRGLGIGGNMVWRNESFPGLIDEVRIYNRVLTAGEISLDMQTPVAGSIPTPSVTASATASATRTSTPTRTFTPTRTPTVTPGPSATPSPTLTRTPTGTPGPSATFTPTSTFTPTMTSGPSPTLSPTFTRTPTMTPLPSATFAPTSTFTPTITTGPSVTPSSTATPLPIAGPLSVSAVNPRYFADPNGNIVYLTGSHTWCEFMDCGSTNPPTAFNYTAFLDFLISKNHNFFRLWRTENSRGGEAGDNFWFSPMPYQRSATECCAFDGGNKFDLNQFNQAYFDRLRQRIIQAGDRGIYVSVMLFDGWSVESKFTGHEPWKGHPYKLSNNANGINGDGNSDGQGGETHTLADPQITALQEAYVRKVIDTVNDLDNVLYEISNESPGNSEAWQYHMINVIKSYEAGKPKQHPVGMTAEYPNSSNTDLFNSPADWISLGSGVDLNTYSPPATDGSKVILADTDHLCGICGNRQWVWKSFTRGENPIFMDIYDNATSSRGMPFTNAYEVEIRNNLGYARSYAVRIHLAAMTPRPDLCSTGYCLANPAAAGAEYLMFLPGGGSATINLSTSPGTFSVEWLNPATGVISTGNPVTGGTTVQLSAPFSGDAVVFLKGELLPTATPSPTPSNTATATSSFTPSPTLTPTPTRTPTETVTASPTVTETSTPSVTPTWTPLPTQSPTATASEIPTATVTSTFTPEPTWTPTATPLPTLTNTPSPTPTETMTASPTVTETFTPSAIPTWTPFPTQTPTYTPEPTATPTLTDTPSPTSSPTDTPSETPTSTRTPTETVTASPTVTEAFTPSVTPTWTPLPTLTDTPSPTPSETAIPSETPTLTVTPSETVTPSGTPTFTAQPTETPTEDPTETTIPSLTPTETITPTWTPMPTQAPSEIPTETVTPTFTPEPTWTPTATLLPTLTNTPSPIPSATDAASETPTPTLTPTETETASPTITEASTPFPTQTPTATPSEAPTETIAPSVTPTFTAEPTETSTPTLLPTNTSSPIPSATNTPSETPTPTATPTETVTPSGTPTFIAVPTETHTATPLPTDTPSPTPSATTTPSETPPSTLAPTETVTASPTVTETFTPTFTPEPTWTSTATFLPTPTATPTQTYTSSPSPTETVAPSNTPTFTAQPTETQTATPTQIIIPSSTPTETITPTRTPLPTQTPTASATSTATTTATASPASTLTPSQTPSRTPTVTPTYSATPSRTPTVTATLTSTLIPTGTPASADVLYLSSTTNGTAGSVAFADEDILSYNRATGVWSMYFDGSDVGITGDVDAFALISDGSILLSLDANATVGTLGTVEDSDIIRFLPTQLGPTTAGSFQWYFDGSDVGLTTTAEDIDAIGFAPDGRLIISTIGSFSVTGVSGNDEDLLAFAPTTLGSTTSGSWSLYFDGSDVGLNDANTEQIDEVWIDPVTNQLYLTTDGTFSVPGVSGEGSDIFLCIPTSLGTTTACSYTSYWIGASNGFAGEIIDGLEIVR